MNEDYAKESADAAHRVQHILSEYSDPEGEFRGVYWNYRTSRWQFFASKNSDLTPLDGFLPLIKEEEK